MKKTNLEVFETVYEILEELIPVKNKSRMNKQILDLQSYYDLIIFV
jgi:hypothetical protein